MARTESITYTVLRGEENDAIQVQQAFGWNLLNAQELLSKTETIHLEKRHFLFGEPKLWSATTKTKVNYIRLTFSRDLDLPNIEKLRELESQYLALQVPPYPSPGHGVGILTNLGLFTCATMWCAGIALILGLLTCGLMWVIAFYFHNIDDSKKQKWKEVADDIYKRRQAILEEARQY